MNYDNVKYFCVIYPFLFLELKVRLEDPIIICVVGNKCDMSNIRQVGLREASEYAFSIGALYHESSALNSQGNSNG